MINFAYLPRLLAALVIASGCILPAAALCADPATVPAFSASYKVRFGVLRGSMTLELSGQDTAYRYETSLRPRGVASWFRRGEIRESTTLSIVDGVVTPVDYINTDTIAKPSRHANYVFDQPAGQVTGQYKSQAVDVPIRTGGQNRISAQVAIMQALLSETEISAFPIFDRARWRDFEFEVIPGQEVKTPSGEFKTVEIRYASKGKDKSYSLHCAAALNYLPVMIVFREGGKTKSRAVLTDYRIDDDAT